MLLLKVTNLASDLRFLQFFCVCQIENIFLIQYLLFTFLKYTNSAITSDLPKSGNNGMSELKEGFPLKILEVLRNF